MITTVTTVTTVTTMVALGLATAISVAAVIALVVFLTTRELASAGRSRLSLRIARFTSIGIVPLIIAFAAMVAVKIAETL